MKQPDRITTAFTTLREQMLLLAERITGNRDDAADAVQDAFVKLWQQGKGYESTDHAQGAGMLTVRNVSIDKARRNSKYVNMSVEQAEQMVVKDDNEPNATAYEQVRSIIDSKLSANQRAIINLREVKGLDFETIARRLGMQPATVRVELSRARKRVRDIYRNRKENQK